jgi:SAM-dependent methyltransferase
VADLYDEVRPGYPEELVEDVLSLSGIPPTGRILEIGCGPGNATLAFARRGYRMLCVELGERLAALAARNCRFHPLVEIQNVSFEDWEFEERAFDLVISADAFHWIRPDIGYPKAGMALKDTGSAAFFWILYLELERDLFRAIDSAYRQIVPQMTNPARDPTPEWVVERIEDSFRVSGCFDKPVVKRYSWSETYTSEQYIKLLATFSAHSRLDEATRTELFARIGGIIDRFGAGVAIPCMALLFHSRVRRPGGSR